MAQVFVSHTKKDKKFCDAFDRVCARVEGIKAFRSEFETIAAPPWKTIKRSIDESVALFFLVGRKLVESQDLMGAKWQHTQNWIAYEIGLACEKATDVWAICDDVLINFPMPYINNYLTVSLKRRSTFDYLRGVIEKYAIGQTFPINHTNKDGKNLAVRCPHKNCEMPFNLHSKLRPAPKIVIFRKSVIRCPHCLHDMLFPEGFPT